VLAVLIADDDEAFRELLKTLILEAGFTVVGEARNGQEAVALTDELEPDVVTMDLDMPVMDGATAIAEIHSRRVTPIVIVSGSELPALNPADGDGGPCWNLSKSDIDCELPRFLNAFLRRSEPD
jgi:chemotaxis response regulator CheB